MEIRREDNEGLRKACKNIDKETPAFINALIKGMRILMDKNNGCGIAAPQVGVNKRLFLAVIDNERTELFINPVITSHSEEKEDGNEGCLSVPGKKGIVERYNSVTIEYYDGRKRKTVEYTGLNARIVQHEYDHLDGIIFVDIAREVNELAEPEKKLA